jgi:hypothetical protein
VRKIAPRGAKCGDQDGVRIQIHDLGGIGPRPIRRVPRSTILDLQIDAVFPTQLRQLPFEGGHPPFCFELKSAGFLS